MQPMFKLSGVGCDITNVIEIDGEAERLVPVATWTHENASIRAIWRSGSPRLTCPADMGKWLRRHEGRLTERGAVLRIGNAWRIVEPGFRAALFEILSEERERNQ